MAYRVTAELRFCCMHARVYESSNGRARDQPTLGPLPGLGLRPIVLNQFVIS